VSRPASDHGLTGISPTRGRPVVYLGPTLPLEEARGILEADYRDPAQQGDVHRALAADPRPAAIGLVDGLWGAVPTVWHVELRAALALGVPVYGAGSLGAIRAAELQGTGMIGVGRVYRAYASGELEDDDEVAVAHAGVEDGWRMTSAPMVDIRATVGAAVRAGTLDPARADRIVQGAKARHFTDRVWPWNLPRVSVKAQDARQMLVQMADDLAHNRRGAVAPWIPTDFALNAWERDTGTEAPTWVAVT
jgi:hypothetical protein